MKDRRILGLKKTPAQAMTERHEDALLQKVAAEHPAVLGGAAHPSTEYPLLADEGGDPASAVASVPAGTPPTDEVPMIDETIPYAIVSGVEGVAYIQGKDFYDRAKRMVREAPMAQWYFAEPPSKTKSAMAKAEEARAELRRKGLWEDVPRLPKALLDIEKENARAAAAEQHAA